MQLGILQGCVVADGGEGRIKGRRCLKFFLFHPFQAFLMAGDQRAWCRQEAGDTDGLRVETCAMYVGFMATSYNRPVHLECCSSYVDKGTQLRWWVVGQ